MIKALCNIKITQQPNALKFKLNMSWLCLDLKDFDGKPFCLPPFSLFNKVDQPVYLE